MWRPLILSIAAGAGVLVLIVAGSVTWSLLHRDSARAPEPPASRLPAPRPPAPRPPAPRSALLEAEARKFYEKQLAAAKAGKQRDVARAIRDIRDLYDRTAFDVPIRNLASDVADSLAEEGRREADEEIRKRRQDTLAAAARAERRGDWPSAIIELKKALAAQDEPRMRLRIEKLQRLRTVDSLLFEADDLERANDWAMAATRYTKVIKLADGERKKKAAAGLARVQKRLAAVRAVYGIRDEIKAERWRVAWDRIKAARAAGHEDPRLETYAAQVSRALDKQKEK